jgi:Flp pilus assembly protein TadD
MRTGSMLAGIVATWIGGTAAVWAQPVSTPGEAASSEPAPSEPAKTAPNPAARTTPTASARPPSAELHYKLGRQWLVRGGNAQAVEAFTLALSSSSGWSAAHGDRGVAHMRLGAWGPAIEDLTKAIAYLAADAPAALRYSLLVNRGAAHSGNGRNEAALADLAKAIELSPGQAAAYASRSRIHVEAKNYDAALRDAKQAITANPADATGHIVQGLAHLGKKMHALAADDFRRALEITPDERAGVLGLHIARLGGKGDEGATSVRLVRHADPGCEPSCPEWIAIQGRIDPGSAKLLEPVLKRLGGRKVPVLVHSGGGSVTDALAMGRAIRSAGLDVAVMRSEPVRCEKGDKVCAQRTTQGRQLARPSRPGSICASSCVFLLASGTNRYVGPSTLVGVHQISSFTTYQQVLRLYRDHRGFDSSGKMVVKREIISETRGKATRIQTPTRDTTYENVRKFFADMGIDARIMNLVMSTPANSMAWLATDQMRVTKIRTASNADELVALPAPSPAASAEKQQ